MTTKSNITIAKSVLLPPLLLVAGAIDKRQSLVILSNILMQVSENSLHLTATDLEMEISASLSCETDIQDCQLTIPAKKLIDIIRSLDEEAHANFTINSGSVIIKSGRSQFKLATLPAKDFPREEKEAAEVEFTINRQALIYLLQATHFAMSQQDVRVFLNGLLLELEANKLTAVAADGHRMAISKLSLPSAIGNQRLLLPRKSVLEILRLLSTISDETVSFSAAKSYLCLKTQDYVFSSKLIDARFPPYSKAIPTDNDKFVLVDKELFKRALSRIVILANEKLRAIVLHLSANELTLIATNQEQEEAIESVEAKLDGAELKIGVNAAYLQDVLNFLPDGLIRLSMSTMDRSILVETLQEDNYLYVIMPMKL